MQDVFEDDGNIHLVMELCTGGSILEHLKVGISMRKARICFFGILVRTGLSKALRSFATIALPPLLVQFMPCRLPRRRHCSCLGARSLLDLAGALTLFLTVALTLTPAGVSDVAPDGNRRGPR